MPPNFLQKQCKASLGTRLKYIIVQTLFYHQSFLFNVLFNVNRGFVSISFGSAYCGGLWLASLCVMCKMATLVNNKEAYEHYRDLLDRGSAAFDKLLWNGEFLC